MLIEYQGSGGDVVIPDGVISIGDGAFAYCGSLKSVTIPDSVTSIDSSAFADCNSLAHITIPDSVTNIGGNAFSRTKWLEDRRKENPLVIVNHILIDAQTASGEVVIPDGVTSIGDSAFSGCRKLTNVIIPNSVTSIGDYAFSDCVSLNTIKVLDGNQRYKVVDGALYYYTAGAGTGLYTLLQYPLAKTEKEYNSACR